MCQAIAFYNMDGMIGQRLAEARSRKGLRQVELAVAMGDRYDQSVISAVEHGRSSLRIDGLLKAARELEVSVDYLVGLTDDPTPAYSGTEKMPKGQNSAGLEVMELAAAAGGGAQVLDETIVGRIWFLQDWLERNAIDPQQSTIITVRGESMEPTLTDGCSILVDRSRREPQEGHIYVVRTEDGLVVKRAGRDEFGRWLIVSDHPAWNTVPWPADAEVIGEVRWMARTL